MRKFRMEFSYLSEQKDIGMAKFIGEVDMTSVPEFLEFMKKLVEVQCKILILNMQQLQYMNSTGFGKIAAFAMEEKDKGEREILFCNMQRHIHSIFVMFGLENLWKNYSSVEEALASYQKDKDKAKQEEEKANTITEEKPKPIEEKSKPVEEKPKPIEERITFPLIRSCTICRKPSNFAKPGTYKCPHCGTIHQIDDKGTLTQTSSPRKKKPLTTAPPSEDTIDEIDISLPSDVKHLGKIRDFIFAFFTEMFSERERADMAMAVDEACSNAIEHAHKMDRNKKLHLHLDVNVRKVSLTVKDSGENTFQNVVQSDRVNQENLKKTGRGMGIFLIKQIMDEVIVKPTEKWGTAITMVKYSKQS